MKVYRYEVEGSRHCREEWATHEENGFFDTFWRGSDRHRLTDTERLSATFIFDTEDFDEVRGVGGRRSDPEAWLSRAPADRARISHQHGLDNDLYIRKGSEPDRETRLGNAREKVEECERKVRSAGSRLTWAEEELAAIESEVTE